MSEKKEGAKKKTIERASGNLEKALEGMSRRLLRQVQEEQTLNKDLGELAKVMKQVAQIRQEFCQQSTERSDGVQVLFEKETEEYAE